LRVKWLASGLACILGYVAMGLLLAPYPVARAILANSVLVVIAALVPIIVLRRRHNLAGCQRLFWDVFAAAMTLWIVGHLGWVYDQIRFHQVTWLQWHTIFSLSAGFGPLVALLARPHLGPRRGIVGPIAMTIGAYCLLAVFVYSYFVLLPGFVPAARAEAQSRLLYFVQSNRLVLLIALVASFWFARETAWRATYLRLSVGVAIGFMIRLVTSSAITRGDYQVGSWYDLAWIAPFLFYAWAAADTPPSEREEGDLEAPHEVASVALLAVPSLLIPLVGYGVINIESIGEPVDSYRLVLTMLATVAALGLVTLRLAAQGGELQRSDARLQLLAAATEHTADLILITHPDGTFEHANAAFLRAFGYSRRELLTLNFVDLVERGVDRVRRDITAEVRATGIWRGTLRGLRKDGTTFPAACTITALRDSSGRVTHFVGVERDITEDLKLRDQLVHGERLSAIGELIAGVAHEINNPLQTIIGCTELMLDEPEGDNRQDLELVRKEAMRAGQIVRNLLAFARRGATDRSLVDLNDLVRATAALREYHLRQINVDLTVRCAPVPLAVLANREEIRQVILNLLLNAEHAIASSGRERGSIVMQTFHSAGQQIVEVTDSGPGITPELRGRIFEPFFTTREVGEGTGLGLSISLGIASAHGGSLTLADSPSGARFQLALPLPAGVDPPAEAPRRTAAPLALVVDDDGPIRKLIVKLLERRGFEVREADTGEAAVAIAGASPPDVVVCDEVPDMTGLHLYRALSSARPALHFVLITADKDNADAAAAEEAGVHLLDKPFTATDLETALSESGIATPRVG
jgi:two-component system NtrC family sensor kinase